MIINYLRRVYKKRIYSENSERLSFLRDYIKPGHLVFDVGANVGELTWVYCMLGARVVAIEPQEKCIDIIKRDFDGNPKIHIEKIALGESVGTIEMHLFEYTTLASCSAEWINRVKESGRFNEELTEKRTISVPTSNLDELIKKYGVPDYLKIDVEGFEVAVLKGMSEVPRVIQLEIASESYRDILDYLKGFPIYKFRKYNYFRADTYRPEFPAPVDLTMLDSYLVDQAKSQPKFWGELLIV